MANLGSKKSELGLLHSASELLSSFTEENTTAWHSN